MIIKPYGDTSNDGAIQLSFTLPIKNCGRAKEAAKIYVMKLGFKKADIVHAEALSDGFTFFVAYAKTDVSIDYDKVEYSEAVDKPFTMDETDAFIKEHAPALMHIPWALTLL